MGRRLECQRGHAPPLQPDRRDGKVAEADLIEGFLGHTSAWTGHPGWFLISGGISGNMQLNFYSYFSMFKERCISVTELRTRTKKCLQGLRKRPKYVFVNNRPVAVLLDIDEFETLAKPDLLELSKEEVSDSLRRQAASARKTPKDELLDI